MKFSGFHRKYLLLIIIIFIACPVYAQLHSRPDNREGPIQSVYLELGGSGVFFTLNYDAIFKNGLGLRLGGIYIPKTEDRYKSSSEYDPNRETALFTGLAMGQYIIGKGPHKFESSVGYMIGESSGQTEKDIPKPPGITFSFGYRYLPKDPGKLTVKAAFTPIISNGKLYPWFGLSIGFVLTREGNLEIR